MARPKKASVAASAADKPKGHDVVADGDAFKVITSVGVEETGFNSVEEAEARVDLLKWYDKRNELMATATGSELEKLERAVPFDELEG